MLKLAQMFAGGVLAAAATCPQISTCKGAGGSYKDLVLNSSAACCQACLDDGASCCGWIFNAEQKDTQCHLKSDAKYIVLDPTSKLVCGATRPVTPVPTPAPPKPAPKGAKNVVFIVSDDMRPSIGAYGLPQAVTPHLDALAKGGVTFMRAHVQFSYCAPSRNSFMSGRRPDATKAYNFLNHFRDNAAGRSWTALPEHFKNNGYLVTGTGKLFHGGLPPNYDQPRSWSADSPAGEAWPYLDKGKVNATNLCNSTCCRPPGGESSNQSDPHFCLFDVQPGTYLLDQTVRNIAAERLTVAVQNRNATGQPFFLGMGMHRPHLGWEFPKPFFDGISADIPEAVHKRWAADVPHLAYHECAEMSRQYFDTDGFGKDFSPQDFSGHQALLRRAYYGCISYVDDLIGQLIATLKELGAWEDTIVSFIGDHGWHLGEHDMWCKMSNSELGTRIPMLISAPFMAGAAGTRSYALAEAVDLYPTLSELAGLSIDRSLPEYANLGGVSLAPIFADPRATVKDIAMSQFPRCWQNNTHHTGKKPGDENNRTSSWETMSDCHWTEREHLDFMGYKMRTANFSLTQWFAWNGTALRADYDNVVGVELYDHGTDDGTAPAAFDNFENVNLHGNPAFADIEKDLRARQLVEIQKWITPNWSTSDPAPALLD